MNKRTNSIENDISIVDGMFEGLRTQLNEAKLDGRLQHADVVVLPYTVGMMEEVAKSFIESHKPEYKDAARKVVAKQLKDHIGSIMDWKEFCTLTG